MSDVVELSPVALASLLGVDAGDAPLLTAGPVRLPRDWMEGWMTRTGKRELVTAEVAMVLGLPVPAVYRFMQPEAVPRLRHRRTGSHLAPRRTVTPADLILFLRELRAAALQRE